MDIIQTRFGYSGAPAWGMSKRRTNQQNHKWYCTLLVKDSDPIGYVESDLVSETAISFGVPHQQCCEYLLHGRCIFLWGWPNWPRSKLCSFMIHHVKSLIIWSSQAQNEFRYLHSFFIVSRHIGLEVFRKSFFQQWHPTILTMYNHVQLVRRLFLASDSWACANWSRIENHTKCDLKNHQICEETRVGKLGRQHYALLHQSR